MGNLHIGDVDLGRYGLWQRSRDAGPGLGKVAEQAGFTTLWLGGSAPDLGLHEQLLDETTGLVIGSSIVNIWAASPAQVAEAWHRVEARHPGRLMLGIGSGHPERGNPAAKPLGPLGEYIDALRGADVPRERMFVAALGPRVVRLSGERTAGALPFLVTPEHTRRSREVLGPEPLLIPEQRVVLTADPAEARAIGRESISVYVALRNYRANLMRLGFSEADLDAIPDSLVDAIVAWGDDDAIAARLRAHLDAGADQVAPQVIARPGADLHEDIARLGALLNLR